MVEFVSFFGSQPWPLLRLIFPETKSPKNEQNTLAMVICDIGYINEIGYCERLANDVVNQNMQLFFVIDARIT